MLQSYLVKTENGLWYAKNRTLDGKWTHHSLRRSHNATAQARYSQFLKQLEEREALFSELRSVHVSDFAEEDFRHVK